MPYGTIIDGASFQSLGTYPIRSGKLRVALAPTATTCVVPDVMRVAQVAVQPAVVVDDNQLGYQASGDHWTSTSGLGGYGNSVSYAAEGDGGHTASWQVDGLPPAEYEVRATWTPYANRATNAPYHIYDGPTRLATVRVNQQLTPSGLCAHGVMFQSLGVYPIRSGSVRVVLSNDADGFVIADAVHVVQKPVWGPMLLTPGRAVLEETETNRAA